MKIKKIDFNSIVTGIIVSFICMYILFPILEGLRNILLNVIASNFKSLMDKIIVYASKGDVLNVTIYGFTSMVLMICFIVYRIVVKDYYDMRNKRKKIAEKKLKLKREIVPRKAVNDSIADFSKGELDKVKNDNKEKKKKYIFIAECIMALTKILEVLWILFIFVFMMFFLVSSTLFYEYRHKLTIVKPYISVQQEEILSSDWARMKEKKDYVDIMDRIDVLFLDNGIEPIKREIK